MRLSPRTHIVAVVVVVVFTVGIWLSGDGVELGWLRFYSAAVFLAAAVVELWDRILWRVPIIQRLGARPRNVRGTWKGRLTSYWVDPATGRSPPAKTVYFAVRQTGTTVSAVLFTNQLKSYSTLASVRHTAGSSSLDYLYVGRPEMKYEEGNRMHHGSASLDIVGQPATRLAGRYWTDRDSRGELEFVERRPQVAEDYQSAERLF